jgi:hypothetical protein
VLKRHGEGEGESELRADFTSPVLPRTLIDKGGGEDASGDCGSAGVARANVESLPDVLSINVRVLLRFGGVAGHSGELDTIKMVFFCCSLRPSILTLLIFLLYILL